jgi:hypothetical protein
MLPTSRASAAATAQASRQGRRGCRLPREKDKQEMSLRLEPARWSPGVAASGEEEKNRRRRQQMHRGRVAPPSPTDAPAPLNVLVFLFMPLDR